MAANKFLLQLITFCALSFAVTRTVCAMDVDCYIKLWKIINSSSSEYNFLKGYHCSPQVIGVSTLNVLHYSWNNCLFDDTDPRDACGPVDPTPFDNRSHVAVVPCVNDCSLEEKAKNLGQANYVAFITWDDHNCSGDLHLQTVSSSNVSSVPLVVAEEDGRELLSFANSPSYVVDINIEYNGIVTFVGLVLASLILVCLFCCLAYFLIRLCCRSSHRMGVSRRHNYSMSKRTLNRLTVKCSYKTDQGMNETCAICLEEFTEGEQVRELPCLHVYHGGCVEKWLKEYKHTCPVCKDPITAKRKKRAAAIKSERTPLLATAEIEASVSYNVLRDNGKDKAECDYDNAHVTTAVTPAVDVGAGVNCGALQD